MRIMIMIIRYNPDVVKDYDTDTFIVKTIQLFYNDDYEEYKNVKEENITDLVCV